MTRNPLCYTLEANYARGKNINHLRQRFDMEEQRLIEREDSEVQDSFSPLYGDMYEIVAMRNS